MDNQIVDQKDVENPLASDKEPRWGRMEEIVFTAFLSIYFTTLMMVFIATPFLQWLKVRLGV